MLDTGPLPYPLPVDPATQKPSGVAFFHEDLELNEKWSDEAGRPVYNRAIIVTIKARGQKTSEASYRLKLIYPDGHKPAEKVYPNIMQRPGIAEAFKAWESKQQLAASGTPLKDVQAAAMKAFLDRAARPAPGA